VSASELRQAVRRAYDFACGYCGVREEDAGSLLELDHFEPRSAGCGDEFENLVYCCTTCNRLKGDFRSTSTTGKRLLHPRRDDLSAHLRLEPDGLYHSFNRNRQFSSCAFAAKSSAACRFASGAGAKRRVAR